MVKKIDYRTLLLYALLAVHVMWLCIHIFLSSQGLINQWKLGGYGMYTGPSPQIYLDIKLLSGEADYEHIYSPYRYQKVNYGFMFYCLETNPKKINIFLSDNSAVVGKDIELTARGNFMTKYPVVVAEEVISSTKIRWTDEQTYHYESYAPKCGHKTYSGAGTFIVQEPYE